MSTSKKSTNDQISINANRLKIVALVEFAIILIVLCLYVAKPSIANNSSTVTTSTISSSYNYQTQYNQLLSTLQNPDIVHLASNKTVTVPSYTNNTAFYNSTYGIYNNYTTDGLYNITINAPYDGYLILYVQKTSAPIFTYGFSSNTNNSDTIYCYDGCPNYTFTSGVLAKGVSGFSDTPAGNTTFYHFIPVLRGQGTFSIDNANNYPISITFSLTYVGDKDSNMTPLTVNYSN